jgi:TDG/mug DNA glycosylase family protein
MEEVTPNEIARSLGVTGLQFRNWLRAQKDAGHPIVAGHEYRSRYRFTRAEADQLATEFQSGTVLHRWTVPTSATHGTSPRAPDPPQRAARARPAPKTAADDPFSGLTMSADPGHRITATWMDETVTTLADLLRPGLNMVIVGINPSPVSVAAGHYYQGQIGQRFYARIAQAGIVDLAAAGSADDAAYAAGIGFTDVVKRPTLRAHGLRPGELQHGRALLDEKLAALHVPRVLFTFKGGAQALLGTFEGHGLLADRTLAGADVFVMPGPMERTDRVQLALAQLADWWACDGRALKRTDL